MNEKPMPEPSIAEVLAGFAADVETFFTVIPDSDLSLDDQDDLTRKFEEIEELVKEARTIVGTSAERE